MQNAPNASKHSFLPIFSLAREKIGPPEARQKRPRRNEPPQATSLFLCARFFLSKPQTEFAVWVFLCKFAATSQSRLRRASIPTPFVPSGHFPPERGNRPLRGEPFVVCIYIGGGQCYTVYIMVFSERNDIHGSACKAGTLTTEFLLSRLSQTARWRRRAGGRTSWAS